MTEDHENQLIKIKSDALRLLSFKPRSVAELRTRLEDKKHPRDLIDETIESLKKQGFLDDEKYAKLFANSQINTRPAGKRQLEMQLKKKGLSKELVSSTINSLEDYDEKKAARDLVSARFHRMTGVSPEKKKARLFAFLARRGFASGVVMSVLADLFKEDAQKFESEDLP